jgi:hypothetical protein
VDGGWRGAWWILAESPGGIGDAEVWVDATALDFYGAREPEVIQATLAGNGGGPWIGALLRFGNYPGAAGDITYMVVARRWDKDANRGQPYYVARQSRDP